MKKLIFALTCIFLAIPCQAKTIYVEANDSGVNNGQDWTNAYKYLQDALADAGSAVKPIEIRVAQGIYKPDQGAGITPGDQTATFQLINGVSLKAGYAGVGESDPNDRDIELYETILNGDLNGDDLPSYPHNTDDNSYYIVTGSGTDTNSILDGFTISGGRGTGMYNYGGSPALVNCTFIDNTASKGGAMYNTHFSDPVVTNCTFSLNKAGENGGAMCNEDSNPVVTGCTFIDNSALHLGGAVYNEGSSPTFKYCTFIDNSAEAGGGGMYNNDSSPMLTNCTFEGNWSGLFGGGFDTVSESSNPIVIGCTFIGNSADNSGGGTSNGTSSLTLINCIFVDNSAADRGGGMYSVLGRNIDVINCTFYGNEATSGNMLACRYGSTVQLTNCIMCDGGNEIWNPRGSMITLTYNDVCGGHMSVYDPCEALVWDEGNIDADPCFADVNNGDFHLKSQAGRWDANSVSWVLDDVTSPCIDAGNPGCPVGEEPVPNGNRRNMGAYGGTAEASKSPANWRSIADLTNDWVVDSNDLKAFVDYWLEAGECIPSDLNRSQSVDFSDFAIFARQQSKNNYILLEIYSDGWGNLLETTTMEEEGQITILVYEEEPYSYPPARYYVYASRDGYYTEIYNCEAFGLPPNNFITVDVDLDPIVPGKFNGVNFMTQWFFSDHYLGNTDVNVVDGDIVVTQFQTDQQGRFAIEIEPGNYYFEFISDCQEYHLEPVSTGGEYKDFFFPYNSPVLKPNIYLYPEETIELDVDIVFPHGGRITTSVPDYNDGWHITVEPSGIIDGQFEYLFYESLQPDYGQYAAGWVVIREQLEGFFRNNMGQTGFNQKEIDDFIEYWIPILTEYPYYAIYPQYRGELEEMIKLEFSAQPESLIRLIYSVRGLEDNNLNIEEPLIPPFTRDGFTVTEWGVILK